ncbi:unnamed protein product [Phaeothamnion confervicola]
MQVRGAPLIAIVAALGLAVEAVKTACADAAVAETFLLQRLDFLRTSRPTAVNLFNMCDDFSALVSRTAAASDATAGAVIMAFVEAAEAMLEADATANRRQGQFGMASVLAEARCAGREKVSLLTHCNTGALACSSFGTALGVIRTLQAAGRLHECFATETRPYNQGARLTAYEMVQDGLPGILITDSMAAALMASGRVDAVVVGADRVVANGDTANKVGTYQLAIVAKHHGVPFFVVAPLTTLDPAIVTGADIVIEQRPAVELTSVQGVQVAPKGIGVWNPAFDVTPAALITGIVTDAGTIYPSKDAAGNVHFAVTEFLAASVAQPSPPVPPPSGAMAAAAAAAAAAGAAEAAAASGAAAEASSSSEYYPLVDGKVAGYVVSLPGMAEILGTSDPAEVVHEEVGDGNLNLVFFCRGPRGVVVVKQALPYVRCVGESWPLSLARAKFEAAALTVQRRACSDHTPEVYHFDGTLGAMAMRFLEPPHEVLRQALCEGRRFASAAPHLGKFLAETLFRTSGLALSATELRAAVAEWSLNSPMCELTEQVVFTHPYVAAPLNRWTSPQLDCLAESLRADVGLKRAVHCLKRKFVESTEALIHGDLHTGSVMAAEGSTFCIDPEFAFYGPMGFDVGAIIGNFLLAYFSHCGGRAVGVGSEHADWVVAQVPIIWNTFEWRFLELWADPAAHTGYLFPADVFVGEGADSADAVAASALAAAAQKEYMASVWRDTLGFAGAKMIRRVVGVAHVEDLEGIPDPDARAVCERRAVVLARRMVIAPEEFASPEDLMAAAQEVSTDA